MLSTNVFVIPPLTSTRGGGYSATQFRTYCSTAVAGVHAVSVQALLL